MKNTFLKGFHNFWLGVVAATQANNALSFWVLISMLPGAVKMWNCDEE
jgi:hypothetical protein